jgi:hypothetical protein
MTYNSIEDEAKQALEQYIRDDNFIEYRKKLDALGKKIEDQIKELFASGKIKISVVKADGEKCTRCYKHDISVVNSNEKICSFCAEEVKKYEN